MSEYYRPDDVDLLRSEFLRRVRARAPSVTQRLHDDVFAHLVLDDLLYLVWATPAARDEVMAEVGRVRRLFRRPSEWEEFGVPVVGHLRDVVKDWQADTRSFPAGWRIAPHLEWSLVHSIVSESAGAHDSVRATLSALDAWGEAVNLTDTWAKTTALRTIIYWTASEAVRNAQGWLLPDPSVQWNITNQFVCDVGKWDPACETELSFRKRANEAFQTKYAEFVSELRNRYEQDGWKRYAERRSRTDPDDPLLALEWLARNQILDEHPDDIGQNHSVTGNAVRLALKKAARQIGFTLHPSGSVATRSR